MFLKPTILGPSEAKIGKKVETSFINDQAQYKYKL